MQSWNNRLEEWRNNHGLPPEWTTESWWRKKDHGDRSPGLWQGKPGGYGR